MDAERLKTLNDRAEKATKLANELSQLTATTIDDFVVRDISRWNDGNRLIEKSLVREIFVLGRLVLIEQKEKELEEIIGKEVAPEVPRVVQCPTGDSYGNPPDCCAASNAQLCS